MIYSAGDLGLEIDFGPDQPGAILQYKEKGCWHDYLVDGGITQFREDWLPRRRNRPLTGEDENLFGFYSMGEGIRPLIDSLEEAGFLTNEAQPSPDLAFGTISNGFLAPCDWLQIEELEESLNGKEPFMVCWLAGSERGEIVEAAFC